MSNLQRVVYLSQNDYDTLVSTGSIVINSGTANERTINYSTADLYITPEVLRAEDLTGILPVNHGGTGRDTFASGQVLIGNGSNGINTKQITDNTSNADVTSSDANLITARTLYYQLAKKGYTTNTGTVTSVTASGANGITISGSPITTSGTINIGLNLNTAINGLSEGASEALGADYLVAQYAGGGTTTTTYHRRPVSKVVNATVVKAALGTNSSHGNTFLRKDGTWQTPPYPVTSVAGKTGAVTLAKDDVGLSNVENTKLSTWAGTSNITTLGTISSGTWNGSIIGTTYGGTGNNTGTAPYVNTTADTSNTLYILGVTSNATTTIKRDTSITIKGDSITAGKWTGTAVAAGYGGTGQTTYTIGDILYCGTANSLSKLGGNTTTTRKFLRSVASTAGTAVAPAWDTVTKTDVGLSNVTNDKQIPLAGSLAITGSLGINATTKGLYLTDSTGNQYGAIFDNGGNLWIGSTQLAATTRVHTGSVYINAGWNGSSGNSSIYVAVPTSVTGGGSAYLVAHAGNVDTGDSNGQIKIAGTNVSVKGLGSNAYSSTSYLPTGGGQMTGNITGNQTVALGTTANPFHNIVLGGAVDATMTASSANPRITFCADTGTQPVHLIYTDYDTYRSPAGLKVIGGTGATPAWFEVEGDIFASGATLTGQVVLSKTTDVASGSASAGALIIGDKTNDHLAFDSNEIMAKASSTTLGTLYLNETVSIDTTGTVTGKFSGPLTGNVTGNVTGNCSGTAGAVAWANVTGRPANAGSANRAVYWSNYAAVACDIPESGAWFQGVPRMSSDGVLEIGKYLDFHTSNTSTNDYDYRLNNSATGVLEGSSTIKINSGYFWVNHSAVTATYNVGDVVSAFRISFKNAAKDTTLEAYPIRFIGTNSTDGYNTCIVLGSNNGTTWVGAGESSSYMPGAVAYNDENLYLSSDNNIYFYTSCANDASTYTQAVTISGGNITASNGVWAGANAATAEKQIGVRSVAGSLYLYAQDEATKNRGIYAPAHGEGAAKNIILVDKDNNATFNGNATNVTGTITVSHGGTGATTLASGELLVGAGTSAVTTKAIYSLTAKGNSGWSTTANRTKIPDMSFMAYWDGSYNGSSSNLSYVGTIAGGTWQGTAIGTGYGGTGATSAVAGRRNLTGAAYVYLTQNSYANLCTAINNVINVNEVAVVAMDATASKAFTNNLLTHATYGLIRRSATSGKYYFILHDCISTQYTYTGYITSATSVVVYGLTGTSITISPN